MPAPEGNQNALKFPTPESRQKLCRDYITHVESGLSDECFPECDPQTLKKYIDLFPVDFDTDKIEVSRRKRQLFWESMGRDGANGGIKGFNAKAWTFNMQNRFGWKEKREDTIKPHDPAKKLAEAMGIVPDDQPPAA